ncbi:HAD family hydrolase [Cetobacterium sp.]|uniref:HAD family hydrolase n=1 Tax=Cetobacterium sp. TaxID=2071632 RepID=UPI003F3AC4EE
MNKYKVVVSDLDGTLLNEDGKISFYTKNIINRLYSNKIRFIIATGRCFETANLIKKALEIECCLITSNGAEIYDEDEKLIYANYIPENIINDLISLQIDESFERFIVQDKIFYTEFKNEFQDDSVTYKIVDFKNKKWSRAINFYYQHENREKLVELQEFLKSIFKKKITLCISTNNRLDVMSYNINKGEGVKKILDKFNNSLNETIAFGDQLNDLEMLKIVEKGFCLKNSCEDLKEKIDKENVIGFNFQDSVAKKLEELFFEEM